MRFQLQHKTMTCPAEDENFFGQDAQYAKLGYCKPQSFTVKVFSGDNVVLDNNTGLMWQQTSHTETYTWDNAKSYCNNLTYAGYSDWRLPTPQELLTIVEINTTYFTPSGYFWSSSTRVGYTNNAWGVSFNYGNVSYSYKTNYNYVRCVR